MGRTLMHVGPSVGNYEVPLAGVKDNVGFNSPEFISAMHDSLEGLRKVTGSDDSFHPFIIPGSGTSAMESITTFLKEGDTVLVASNGIFGDRWKSILNRYRVNVDYIAARAGYSVTPELIKEKVGSRKYRMAFFTHVETSTGVRAPVDELSSYLKSIADYVVLDGVASVGGETGRAKVWNLDAYVTASQKALGAPPGAGMLVVSDRLMNNVPTESVAGYALDLQNWRGAMLSFLNGKGAYFATPPVHTILALQKAFSLIEQETLEERILRHQRVRDIIVAGLREMNLDTVAREQYRSNTVTGVLLEGLDTKKLLDECFRLGVEFAAGVHPDLAGRYIRIGHMGWVTEKEAYIALQTLKTAIKNIQG